MTRSRGPARSGVAGALERHPAVGIAGAVVLEHVVVSQPATEGDILVDQEVLDRLVAAVRALAAFEQAPCYRELVESERAAP